MSGDILASGARKASFGMPKVSQAKWDEAVGTYEPFASNIKPKEDADKESIESQSKE